MSFNPKAIVFSVGPSLPVFRKSQGGIGKLAANLMGPTQWTPAADLLGTDFFVTPAHFNEALMERYHLEASYLSAGAFASGMVFARALKNLGRVDTGLLRTQLTKTNFHSFYGNIRFNENGLNNQKPIYTLQIQTSAAGFHDFVAWPLSSNPIEQLVYPFPGWGRRQE